MASFNGGDVEKYIKESEEKATENIFKKFPVGCDEDKEKIFCFPFILDKETISYIANHAHVMFIIRGPPSTGKATLSEMITERYPHAVYCCADRYFTDSFSRSARTKESIKESHVYCTKNVEKACKSNAETIIVQNTHMRKWEMQQYIDFANSYNYTIVMAITLYRFDCTPEALAENNTDGLDIKYFINRLRQWEDVPPLLTGWFFSPYDSLHLLSHTIKALESLLCDGKFCRVFDAYDIDDIRNYFNPRKVLYCLATFSRNQSVMKNYYLSDVVQASYGKSYTLNIVGYLVTINEVFGIVHLNANMALLLQRQNSSRGNSNHDLADMLNTLNIHHDVGDVTSFPQDDLPSKTTLKLQNRDAAKKIEASKCGLISLASKDSSRNNYELIHQEFVESIQSMVDENGFLSTAKCTEVGSGNENMVYRLPDDKWFIKSFKDLCLQSIFTGHYI